MSLENRLFHAMMDRHPRETAFALSSEPPQKAAGALLAADPGSAVQVLTEMSPHIAVGVVEVMSPESAGPILSRLEIDMLVRLLRSLNAERRNAVLQALRPEITTILSPLLKAKEQTAGALLSSRVLALSEDLSVSEALGRIRASANLVRYYVYVTDRQRKLVGIVNLKELYLALPEVLLRDVSQGQVQQIREAADLRMILSHPGWAEFHTLPVVDDRDVFLGVITHSTVRRIAADVRRTRQDSASSTVGALAELFLTGAGGVLQAMASAVSLGASASRRS